MTPFVSFSNEDLWPERATLSLGMLEKVNKLHFIVQLLGLK